VTARPVGGRYREVAQEKGTMQHTLNLRIEYAHEMYGECYHQQQPFTLEPWIAHHWLWRFVKLWALECRHATNSKK